MPTRGISKLLTAPNKLFLSSFSSPIDDLIKQSGHFMQENLMNNLFISQIELLCFDVTGLSRKRVINACTYTVTFVVLLLH